MSNVNENPVNLLMYKIGAAYLPISPPVQRSELRVTQKTKAPVERAGADYNTGLIAGANIFDFVQRLVATTGFEPVT